MALGIPTTKQVNLFYLTKLTETTDTTIDFCKCIGLIPEFVKCPSCKCALKKPYYIPRSAGSSFEIRYQCNKRFCRTSKKRNSVSLKKGTWFGNCHMSLQKSLFLTYCFVHQLSYKDTIRETTIAEKFDGQEENNRGAVVTSSETVSDYKHYCREICYNIVADNSENAIGGPGKIVEIDESKFGKTKYEVGRRIEGQWVFGGICRQDRTVFLECVESRDADTLIPIIKQRIKPGTTIISDCWRSYDRLSREDFEHLTVNHSYNFVDPDTGAHTQNVENLWWQIKRQLPETFSRHNLLYLHLAEYMWRSMIHSDCDKFITFLTMAARYYRSPDT